MLIIADYGRATPPAGSAVAPAHRPDHRPDLRNSRYIPASAGGAAGLKRQGRWSVRRSMPPATSSAAPPAPAPWPPPTWMTARHPLLRLHWRVCVVSKVAARATSAWPGLA